MYVSDSIIRARGQIIFILGMCIAFSMVIGLENIRNYILDSSKNIKLQQLSLSRTNDIEILKHKSLTTQEIEWAKIAWKYFEKNTDYNTGLVSSVENFPSTTMWDTASALMGIISSYEIGLIQKTDFNFRISTILKSLAKIPLYEGVLPNKAYDIKTLQMVDYNNQPTSKGIGWSAIDIGRIYVPLNIIIWNYPHHTQLVQNITDKWDLNALLDDGIMIGAAHKKDGTTINIQEGRLGYEQYAAKSLTLMGKDVSKALDYSRNVKMLEIEDTEIIIDSREPERYSAHNFIVSDPYILDGIEFGWDHVSKELSWRVYQAQYQRYKRTGQLTAVNEDHLDQHPYFVYNTVYSSGKPWNTITQEGHDASKFRTISTKAAFGWDALYNNEYTQRLVKEISTLNNADKGWFSGLYEETGKANKSITANTNGIILESLAYKQQGKLISVYKEKEINE